MRCIHTCHQASRESFQKRFIHSTITREGCTGCHLPHGADKEYQLRGLNSDLCVLCHPRSEFHGPSVHQPVAKGECLVCHDSHASEYHNVLRMTSDQVCIANGCHSLVTQQAKEARIVHEPLTDKKCVSCHNAHGSKLEHYLKSSAGSLCLFCHEDMLKRMEKEDAVVHSPTQDGECLTCHTGHISDYEGLLLAQGKDLCTPCHNTTDSGFQDAHMNIPADESNCLICHESHTSEEKGLYLPVTHQPFIQKDCQVCHE